MTSFNLDKFNDHMLQNLHDMLARGEMTPENYIFLSGYLFVYFDNLKSSFCSLDTAIDMGQRYNAYVTSNEEKYLSKASADKIQGIFDRSFKRAIVIEDKPSIASSSPALPAALAAAIAPKKAPVAPAVASQDQVQAIKPAAKNKAPNDLLMDFYQGKGLDSQGRSLEEMLAWNEDKKEVYHDYIQWLFPLQEPSKFNKQAPTPDAKLIDTMKKDPQVIANLKRSFASMMEFYGLIYDEKNNDLSYAPHFKERVKEWVTPGNHNFMRITRILKSLVAFGLRDEAALFLYVLKDMIAYSSDVELPYEFWQDALTK